MKSRCCKAAIEAIKHEYELKNLTEDQRRHLAWRLDHKTCCGLITACKIARGEKPELTNLVDIFRWAGKSELAAKIHARKVINYSVKEAEKKLLIRNKKQKTKFRMEDLNEREVIN
jgi:hypothetical protein